MLDGSWPAGWGDSEGHTAARSSERAAAVPIMDGAMEDHTEVAVDVKTKEDKVVQQLAEHRRLKLAGLKPSSGSKAVRFTTGMAITYADTCCTGAGRVEVWGLMPVCSLNITVNIGSSGSSKELHFSIGSDPRGLPPQGSSPAGGLVFHDRIYSYR